MNQKRILEEFIKKYYAIIAENDRPKKTTLHFNSLAPIKQNELEKEL